MENRDELLLIIPVLCICFSLMPLFFASTFIEDVKLPEIHRKVIYPEIYSLNVKQYVSGSFTLGVSTTDKYVFFIKDDETYSRHSVPAATTKIKMTDDESPKYYEEYQIVKTVPKNDLARFLGYKEFESIRYIRSILIVPVNTIRAEYNVN